MVIAYSAWHIRCVFVCVCNSFSFFFEHWESLYCTCFMWWGVLERALFKWVAQGLVPWSMILGPGGGLDGGCNRYLCCCSCWSLALMALAQPEAHCRWLWWPDPSDPLHPSSYRASAPVSQRQYSADQCLLAWLGSGIPEPSGRVCLDSASPLIPDASHHEMGPSILHWKVPRSCVLDEHTRDRLWFLGTLGELIVVIVSGALLLAEHLACFTQPYKAAVPGWVPRVQSACSS